MMKNALESTEAGGTVVVIGCKKMLLEDCEYTEFWVNNKAVIPRSVGTYRSSNILQEIEVWAHIV